MINKFINSLYIFAWIFKISRKSICILKSHIFSQAKLLCHQCKYILKDVTYKIINLGGSGRVNWSAEPDIRHGHINAGAATIRVTKIR